MHVQETQENYMDIHNINGCDNCSKCSGQKNNLQIHVKRHTSENHSVVRNVGNQATPLIDNKPINTKCIHAKCWLVTKVIINFNISAIQGYI